MKLVKNGYSDNARPSRGYHDWVVIIAYEGESEAERMGAAKAVAALFGSNTMWAGVVENSEHRLVYQYGYDSSD